jgi:hypothetical protein
MGQLLNKKIVIDPETGEIVKEQNWTGYDGFGRKGYKYRSRACCIKYYFDSMPNNISKDATLLLYMIAELMNDENVLIYKVERKSKFSTIIYKPLDKEDISERIRFRYGQNKFDRCWKELTKNCLKRIKYYDITVWAVNPSVISKCREVPIWLYEEFQEYMNPHLSAITIRKLQNMINNQ